jgi:hypothetical protein
MSDEKIEKTDVEKLREKIAYALKKLEDSRISSEKEATRHAVNLAKYFADKDDRGKQLQKEYHLKYLIATAEAGAFQSAIYQVEMGLQYG